MVNIYELFSDLLNEYPINCFQLIDGEINIINDDKNRQKLLQNINIINEINGQMKIKKKFYLMIKNNNYLSINYNYLFAILLNNFIGNVDNNLIIKYIEFISNNYLQYLLFNNIINYNLIKMYDLNLLSEKIILKLLGYNSTVINKKKKYFYYSRKTHISKYIPSNIIIKLTSQFLDKYREKFVIFGVLEFYLDYYNLTGDNILNLIYYFTDKYYRINNNDNIDDIAMDNIIKIMKNNNCSKDIKYLRKLLSNNLQFNEKLCKYYFPETFDVKILDYIKFTSNNLLIYLLENYPNKKIDIFKKYCKNYLYILIDSNPYFINYYVDEYIINNFIEGLKYFDKDELINLENILIKYNNINISDYFLSYMRNNNIDATNLLEYFIFLGYVPGNNCLQKFCKYFNYNFIIILINDWKIIPNEKCLENLFDCVYLHKNSKNNKSIILSIIDLINIFIGYKINITDDILKKCMKFDINFNTNIFEILVLNRSNINENIIDHALTIGFNIPNIKNYDIIFDEQFYYKCFMRNISISDYNFDIDKNILQMRKIFEKDNLKTILKFMNDNKIDPDNYCISNAIINKNSDVLEYMINNYEMPLSCSLMLSKNNNKKIKNFNVILNNLLYNLHNYEDNTIMCQKCTKKVIY